MRILLTLMASAVLAAGARAQIATNAGYDDLLYAATRYGNTEARRADKEAARQELFRRGPDSLREVMNRIHFDNIMLSVLAQELVVDQVPVQDGMPVLLDYLDHERPETRRSALYLLGFYPPPAKPGRILKGLEDGQTRNVTLRTAGKWKLGAARPEVRRWLKEGDRERTRVLAANALREIGNPDDLPALVAALGDPVFTVRHAAARAVASFGWPAHRLLLRALPEAQGAARRQIVRLLGELQVKSAVRPLRRLLDEPEAGLRADVERALRQIAGETAARPASSEAGAFTEAEPLFVVP